MRLLLFVILCGCGLLCVVVCVVVVVGGVLLPNASIFITIVVVVFDIIYDFDWVFIIILLF